MVRQDVVEGDVLDDMSIVEDKFDVLWTIQAGIVPELKQSLLVLMYRNTGFRQFRMKQLPQISEVWTEQKFFLFGEK